MSNELLYHLADIHEKPDPIYLIANFLHSNFA